MVNSMEVPEEEEGIKKTKILDIIDLVSRYIGYVCFVDYIRCRVDKYSKCQIP